MPRNSWRQRGFHVTIAWGRDRGVDIQAVSPSGIVLLEAKGSAQNPPQQVNYFLSALGELLQRIAEPGSVRERAVPRPGEPASAACMGVSQSYRLVRQQDRYPEHTLSSKRPGRRMTSEAEDRYNILCRRPGDDLPTTQGYLRGV